MRSLPPLNGLRAFEATGRLGSITAAGAELNVGPPALSRLVKLLEQRMGVDLCERGANSLRLTPAGRALALGLSVQFDALEQLVSTVKQSGTDKVLTLGVGPTLAMRWLIPRLIDFQRLYPEIEIRIANAQTDGPVMRPDWTASIRPGSGVWPSLTAHPLFSAESFPVAAPGPAKSLKSPKDLEAAVLLRVAGAEQDWPDWLDCAGAGGIRLSYGPVFDTAALALQAALDGLGVAIARAPFVADDLAAGRLIRPFPVGIRRDKAWYFIHRSEDLDKSPVREFRIWLERRAAPLAAAPAAGV